MNKEKMKKNLLDFIDNCTCAFTSVQYLKKRFLQEGFQELDEEENWHLKEGNYFVTRNDATIIAFKIPKKKEMFHIITTHLDTPALLLKPSGNFIKSNYLKHNIMPYGGLLNYGWLDHPLSLAGRVIIEKKKKFSKQIVDFKEPIAVIPSVAIHQNDKANSNLDLNMQVDLQPFFSITNEESDWQNILKEHLSLKNEEKICDYDLFLYNNEKPSFIDHENILLSPRIDNITSVAAAYLGFINSNPKTINVFCSFNNEEIGSLTREGADSNFLLDILKRIAGDLEIDISNALAKSFIISSDNTHAIHPNHPEYADDTGVLELEKGFAIVRETSSTTESYFSSILKYLCDVKKIPYQDGTAKNDLAGGSTLSGLSLRHVSVTSIDVGIPELAMHSSLEVCSLNDFYALANMMNVFYNSEIIQKKESTEVII